MSTDFRPPFLDIPPLLQAGGTVHLPGSKSISNRALLLSGLCAGHTTLQGVLDSDDTRVMLAALAAIGCSIQRTGADTVDITGIGGQLPNGVGADAASPLELCLGNAGTAMRPLTAALAMLGGHFTLTGVARMYERPIGDLVDGLQQLGCHVSYLREAGFPPLRIAPRDPAAAEASAPAHITVRGDVSSQFLTALLMAAPLARHTTTSKRNEVPNACGVVTGNEVAEVEHDMLVEDPLIELHGVGLGSGNVLALPNLQLGAKSKARCEPFTHSNCTTEGTTVAAEETKVAAC